MLLFKHVFDPAFEEKLPGIFKLLNDLMQQETGLQYMQTLLRYLIANIEDMSSEKLKSIVEGSMSEKEGETVMTFANTMLGKSFYQGVEQGMQQGMLQELKEAVMDLMDIRYGTLGETDHVKRLINTMGNIERLKALKHKIKSGASIAEITSMMGN